MEGLKVPFIPAAAFEREARELLRQYGEFRGAPVQPPIDIDGIMEKFFKLTVEIADVRSLLKRSDVLGATWITQKLVRVDESIAEQEGRYAFTLAHEAGHWWLHRPLLEAAKVELPLFPAAPGQAPAPAIVCRTAQGQAPIEWQANRFAACLLMPAKELRLAAAEVFGHDVPAFEGLNARRESGDFDPRLHAAARDVIAAGGFSNVSNEAMRNRLWELGLVVDQSQAQVRLL